MLWGKLHRQFKKLHKAARLWRSGTIIGAAEAGVLEHEGRNMLTPTEPIAVSAGEVLPSIRPDDGYVATYIMDTLQTRIFSPEKLPKPA